ncbi:uncharacterized protein CG45078-like isoform X4 [Eurosta solidaginis]|uniref:uncharacterized protein CG45078-like isoform X4 n=1 Tax=Eurosta solidaginis TaxID=178769 RepID=UPI003530D384
MVYESGFSTRRTYSSRPVVTSYAVSSKNPINWEKCPYVPRPTLIADPVTAFGLHRPYHEQRKPSILDPVNRAAIKPSYKILDDPIKPYVSARDKNRKRVLNMVRKHIETVEAGGNTAARTSRQSLDAVLPCLHHTASKSLPIRRETYQNERSGAVITKYVF